jgi:hypothetical protein
MNFSHFYLKISPFLTQKHRFLYQNRRNFTISNSKTPIFNSKSSKFYHFHIKNPFLPRNRPNFRIFLSKNPIFSIKNPDFPIKNPHFYLKFVQISPFSPQKHPFSYEKNQLFGPNHSAMVPFHHFFSIHAHFINNFCAKCAFGNGEFREKCAVFVDFRQFWWNFGRFFAGFGG